MKIPPWLPLAWLVLALTACNRGSDASSAAPPAPSEAAVSTPRPGDLPRYHWQLHDAVDANGQRLDALFGNVDRPLQVDFADGRISVSNACNAISGSYRVVDAHLLVAQLIQTRRACIDPTMMQREAVITRVLNDGPSLILATRDNTPTLTLATGDGLSLTFGGAATAQSRYGSTGETLFLEVAPDDAACHHPLMPQAPCLRMRELHYGADGLRQGEPGPWQTWSSGIEGYTPQPGTRNVLRVQRYTRAHVPTDASSIVYVLDTVIESETLAPATAGSSTRR